MRSVWNTLFLTAVVTVVSLFIGLTVSIGVFDKSGAYISFIRTCYYLPVVVSTVVMAMIWSFLLNPASGLIPYLMRNMGMGNVNLLGDKRYVLWIIAIVTIVASLGTCMIMYIAALAGISREMFEAAEIDGASYFRILWSIYVPLSKPVFATLALFYAVGRWNGYSDALMYMNNKDYYPLQLLLYNILNNINSIEVATQEGFSAPGLSESLKAAIVMFSTVPILCVYPWLQKYFIHGVTMGAVKE